LSESPRADASRRRFEILLALAFVVLDDQRATVGGERVEASIEAVAEALCVVPGVGRHRWSDGDEIRNPIDRRKRRLAPALQQHQPCDAARILSDVVHDGLLELLRQSIQRLVRALVGRPPTAPVEELVQRASQTLVLERCPIGVRVEPEQEPRETGGRDRAIVVESMWHRRRARASDL
jgi:hypothetical protein